MTVVLPLVDLFPNDNDNTATTLLEVGDDGMPPLSNSDVMSELCSGLLGGVCDDALSMSTAMVDPCTGAAVASLPGGTQLEVSQDVTVTLEVQLSPAFNFSQCDELTDHPVLDTAAFGFVEPNCSACNYTNAAADEDNAEGEDRDGLSCSWVSLSISVDPRTAFNVSDGGGGGDVACSCSVVRARAVLLVHPPTHEFLPTALGVFIGTGVPG